MASVTAITMVKYPAGIDRMIGSGFRLRLAITLHDSLQRYNIVLHSNVKCSKQ